VAWGAMLLIAQKKKILFRKMSIPGRGFHIRPVKDKPALTTEK
jgi:hypothetical protein